MLRFRPGSALAPRSLTSRGTRGLSLAAIAVLLSSMLTILPAQPVRAAAPSAPTLNAPTNGATGQSTHPTLSVKVTDPDNNAMTVTFMGRPFASGNFAQIAQKTGVASGATTTDALVEPRRRSEVRVVRDCRRRNDSPRPVQLDLPDDRRRGPGLRRRRRHLRLLEHERHGHGKCHQWHRRHIFTAGDNVYPGRNRSRLHQLLCADAVGHGGGQVADPADPRQPRLEYRATSMATTAISAPTRPTRTARATTATTSPAATGTSSISTANAPWCPADAPPGRRRSSG